MSLVLDCSVALAWLYPAETTPAVLDVLNLVADQGATVPELWRIEIANALTMAMRSRRISAGERTACLTDLAQLLINDDDATGTRIWGDTLRLADKHRLTVYDATYLELALRLRLPLATLDEPLRAAARQEKIRLLGR